MSNLRVMVVGVGALGRHHARIVAGLNDAELAVVAEPREDIGRPLAEQYGAEWVADFRSALDRVDAASIVVPTFAHGPVAAEFLKRRLPILVEKPLAADAAQARELVALANANQTLLQVGHVERFNPAFQTARQHAGSPKYIRAERVSPFPFRSLDISVVQDLLIHDIDLTLDLAASPVVDVRAFGTRVLSDHEDMVTARLTFENGCIADLTASRVHPSARREMQIWSALGCVTIDFQSRQVSTYSLSESLLFGRSLMERAREPAADIEQLKKDIFGKFIRVDQPAVPEGDALTAELREFVTCVRNRQEPSCSGREALKALEVADRVAAAMKAGRPAASLPLRDAA